MKQNCAYDLKAVLIERFNRTLLHTINKPMLINGV